MLWYVVVKVSGGGGGIRTLDGLSPMPVFKTGAFNRSATPPDSKNVCFTWVRELLGGCQVFSKNTVCHTDFAYFTVSCDTQYDTAKKTI